LVPEIAFMSPSKEMVPHPCHKTDSDESHILRQVY